MWTPEQLEAYERAVNAGYDKLHRPANTNVAHDYYAELRQTPVLVMEGRLLDLETQSAPAHYVEVKEGEASIIPLDPAEPWERDQWQYVQQMRAQVLHLNTKVNELQAKKRPKGNY